MDVALGSDGKSLDFTAAGGQVNNVAIPSVSDFTLTNALFDNLIYYSSDYKLSIACDIEIYGVFVSTAASPPYPIYHRIPRTNFTNSHTQYPVNISIPLNDVGGTLYYTRDAGTSQGFWRYRDSPSSSTLKSVGSIQLSSLPTSATGEYFFAFYIKIRT